MWKRFKRWCKRFGRIEHKCDRILERLSAMSKEIDDLRAAVSANTNTVDSAVLLLKGLADRIASLPADNAAIAALAAEVKAKSDELAASVVENTPGE